MKTKTDKQKEEEKKKRNDKKWQRLWDEYEMEQAEHDIEYEER